MSVISKQNCSKRRRGGHRYWSSQKGCRITIEWTEGQWGVSFVDTNAAMTAWMTKYASNILMFDCEWSPRTTTGVGLIQFATLPSVHQVLIVDCSVVDLTEVRDIFTKCQMVGWATGGDKSHLALESENIIDLQKLFKQSKLREKMNEEDKTQFQNYQPLNRHGEPHYQAWSLDDMAQCFLGHSAKVPLNKHPPWSEKKYKFEDTEIHYAANDVIGLAYIYNKLKYIYELRF